MGLDFSTWLAQAADQRLFRLTQRNSSGCGILQRVYRSAGRSHMLKMRICVYKILWSCRCVWLITRNRVGIIIHSIRHCPFWKIILQVHWIVLSTAQRGVTTADTTVYVCKDKQCVFAQDTRHTRKDQSLVNFSHVQMRTPQFTVLSDCSKENWRCMLGMRLSSQTSVDIQSQHQAQSAFHRCCNPTFHEGLPSLPRILVQTSPVSADVATDGTRR